MPKLTTVTVNGDIVFNTMAESGTDTGIEVAHTIAKSLYLAGVPDAVITTRTERKDEFCGAVTWWVERDYKPGRPPSRTAHRSWTMPEADLNALREAWDGV